MAIERDETDTMLFNLVLECARPSWRFRVMFNARERQLLGFAINTFMGNRHHNQFMAELNGRFPSNTPTQQGRYHENWTKP